ncbi:hypothetical protein OG509_07380 [Streptomyces sp. NBC_01006]|nr:hypothetical protein OG509_07380 [Streptomyces sp. NBC_01006]
MEAGITHFDRADIHRSGKSEAVFGEVLARPGCASGSNCSPSAASAWPRATGPARTTCAARVCCGAWRRASPGWAPT